MHKILIDLSLNEQGLCLSIEDIIDSGIGWYDLLVNEVGNE